MKHKIWKLFICSFVVLTLAGCDDKTKITADEFKTKMEEQGLRVEDATDQMDEGLVEKVYIALNDNFQVEFYETLSEDIAINAYAVNKEKLEDAKGNVTSSSSVDVKNYSKYTLTSNDKWNVVSRVENTFIFVSVPSEYKEEVETLLDGLGY